MRISSSFVLPTVSVAAAMVAVSALPSRAQVPHLLSYQGRVKVNGADFSGTGQFKFALVSGAGSTTYWSNDGTSTGGSQPAAAVSLPVSGGLYSVHLGDAALPNMTALTAGVFANSDVRLRVWFSDGANGWQQLTPDQRVAAVGYALMADEVRDGSITAGKLADGAVTAPKIAAGAVSGQALAAGAAAQNLAASGQGGVPSGAMLVSPEENSATLTAAGYVPAGMLGSSDSWIPIAGGTARLRATSVWTGSEFLIWGDGDSGWRYKPSANTWTAMSVTNQPANRERPVGVWTGTEMMVWGGVAGSTYYQTGGRYNPATDTWTAMTNANPPGGRIEASAVWTGTEMIMFGGRNAAGNLGDTWRYNPAVGAGGTWTAVTATGGPAARSFHTAVWTGAEMIIHGGLNETVGSYADCVIFNPTGAGTWVAGAAGPTPRYYHTAVWTGSKMIVWGGSTYGGTYPVLNTGSAYNRSTNTWTPISTAGAPDARFQHGAVWSGSEMMVWGGSSSAVNTLVYLSSGGRYHADSDTWTGLTTTTAPSARVLPRMAWTGSEMLVWGGSNGADLNTGGRYRGGQTLYLYQRP